MTLTIFLHKVFTIVGKKFSEIPAKFKAVFNDYPLTIIYLPQRLDLGTKLEIFRRINEGGYALNRSRYSVIIL